MENRSFIGKARFLGLVPWVEVKSTLWLLGGIELLGWDGFLLAFVQKFWDVLFRQNVLNLSHQFFS